MNKKNLFSLLGISTLAVVTVGCSSPQVVVFPMYSAGENLQALTKVTEGENTCDYPFGGDHGKNLYFTVHDKSRTSSNIYKKENPFSASVSQVTSGMNQNMAPSYNAATGKLVFAGHQEGARQRDIYMINLSQTNALAQITNTPNEEENFPCLSSDGRMVVYELKQANVRNMDTQIWLKNLITNETVQLGLGRMPSFSPDGRTITYVKYTDDGQCTCLWTMNVDGSNKVQLTYDNMGSVWHPRFSPDGRRIVFQCVKREKQDGDIYVVDRNGNNLMQLTMNNSYDGEPYWADDGNIYFTSDRGGNKGFYQIWRFKFGGGTAASAPVVTEERTTYTPATPQVTQSTTHKVVQGENISQVAQRYGVSVADIVRWNGLRSMTLTPGMTLKVSAQ